MGSLAGRAVKSSRWPRIVTTFTPGDYTGKKNFFMQFHFTFLYHVTFRCDGEALNLLIDKLGAKLTSLEVKVIRGSKPDWTKLEKCRSLRTAKLSFCQDFWANVIKLQNLKHLSVRFLDKEINVNSSPIQLASLNTLELHCCELDISAYSSRHLLMNWPNVGKLHN